MIGFWINPDISNKVEIINRRKNLWYHLSRFSGCWWCFLLSIKHLTILKTVWYQKLIFIDFDIHRIKDHDKKLKFLKTQITAIYLDSSGHLLDLRSYLKCGNSIINLSGGDFTPEFIFIISYLGCSHLSIESISNF